MGKSSRKTKKTWVKNIDLNDIEQNLEHNRDRQRDFGLDTGDDDFIIDESADASQVPVGNKKLKATEILSNKSKVPGLNIERNNKPKPKSITRLMKIAGRIDNSTSMSSVDKNGLVKASNKDIWDDEVEEQPSNVPERLPKSKSTKPINKPVTITKPPIKLDYATNELHPGKSYNPSLQSWRQLIDEEFGSEQIKEMDRQRVIEKQEMLMRILQEEESSDDDDDNDNDNDADDNDNSNDNDSNDPYKLSINKPTQNKKKTRTQRNKQLRQQKREDLQSKLKELKNQINEINKLDMEAINKESEKLSTSSDGKVSKPKPSKAPKKLFKYNMREKPMEVKLSNELNSNLKNVKAEGNLFYSNMINLQAKGLIESRVPVAKKSKYKPKITEKWTYKDFK